MTTEARVRQQPALLSQRQAAELLGVSRRTLRRMMDSGSISPVRVPGLGRPRFRREDVERLIREAVP